MTLSQLLQSCAVDCGKATFPSTLLAQDLPVSFSTLEESTLFSVALPEGLVLSSAATT